MRLTMASRARSALLCAGALCALAGSAAISAPQAQSSCQGDFEKPAATPNARIGAVNALQKKGKGKLDPIAACPRMNALASAEQAMLDYMTKNQKWCGIPEDVVNQARAGVTNTRKVAGQACGIAAKVKQMQAQAMRQARQRAAEGGGGGPPAKPALPTGPL